MTTIIIEKTTWTTRHGFPDEKVHQGLKVTTPAAMGTETLLVESYTEAEQIVSEYFKNKTKIDAERTAIAKYCTENAWSNVGT